MTPSLSASFKQSQISSSHCVRNRGPAIQSNSSDSLEGPRFLPRGPPPAQGLSIATSLGGLKATPTPAPQLCLSKKPGVIPQEAFTVDPVCTTSVFFSIPTLLKPEPLFEGTRPDSSLLLMVTWVWISNLPHKQGVAGRDQLSEPLHKTG